MTGKGLSSCADPEGGTGGLDPPPPEKSQKYRVSKQYWPWSPNKSQSYQASIQFWANMRAPFKWRFGGRPMMARLWWHLDPFSDHQLIKKPRQSWTPSGNFLDLCMEFAGRFEYKFNTYFTVDFLSVVVHLTLCMLGNFSCFCCLLTVFKINCFKNGTLSVSNGLDPDQDRRSVGPDLCSKLFKEFSADDKSCLFKGKSSIMQR